MNNTLRGFLGIIVIALLALFAWALLTTPDHRTTGQRLGDAVDALPKGIDKAGRELEDRTPGAKLGDAVKDAGQNIKDSTNK